MQKCQVLTDHVVYAVRDLARSVYSGDKVEAAMSALVATTSQLPLVNLDYWENLIRFELMQSLRSSIRPKWGCWSKLNQSLSWLDLISCDGYMREKTLLTMNGAAPNVFFFSMIIRRLNDWVPQVRKAARERIPKIASESNPEHVVEVLCIVLSNWNSWGRIEEADKKILLQIASQDAVIELLKHKLISSSSGPLLLLLSQLGRTAILDKHLEQISASALQPWVRARAYRILFERRIVWVEGKRWEWTDIRYCKGRLKSIVSERSLEIQIPFLKLLERSAIDRSSIVRRVSAEFLIQELDSLGDLSKVYADKFAADSSSSVSERGKFALKKLKEMRRMNVVP